MRLLEYEAKRLIAGAIRVPIAFIVTSAQTAIRTPVVLKSQVPTGGRGKAGGIRVVTSQASVPEVIIDLFNLQIKGFTPTVLLAEELLEIAHEYYLVLVIDKATASIQLLAYRQGGIEVEINTPHDLLKLRLTHTNINSVAKKLADYYNLPAQAFNLQGMLSKLYDCFRQNDATLLEINPLVLTIDHQLVAGDCKMELDDTAYFRHPDWQFEAGITNTNFVTINNDGTVATIANGAGLAMATVDGVVEAGFEPANFLDIGGGASAASVIAAFKKIMEFSGVKAIVINIFAGITRSDEVAKAILSARRDLPHLPPLFIRLSGTNAQYAAQLLANEQIATFPTLEAALLAMRSSV